jgi:FkbM family methyltransferase
MIRSMQRFLKPEYFFQPGQIFRRLARRGVVQPEVSVVVPWGLSMTVNPSETVGHALWHLGVYDLIASEIAWRLLQPGETAVDVGANVGVMSGLMARRVGSRGSVTAFEPHPKVFGFLQRNVNSWQKSGLPIGSVQIRQLALSRTGGEGEMSEPPSFSGNYGLASLEPDAGTHESRPEGRFVVRTARMDAEIPGPVHLLKVDVEGHEAKVFAGAESLLKSGVIRDILFEDHHPFPSEPTTMLQAAGYTLFFMTRTFWGPVLARPEEAREMQPWLPPNWLATKNPERALKLCKPSGWKVLG